MMAQKKRARKPNFPQWSISHRTLHGNKFGLSMFRDWFSCCNSTVNYWQYCQFIRRVIRRYSQQRNVKDAGQQLIAANKSKIEFYFLCMWQRSIDQPINLETCNKTLDYHKNGYKWNTSNNNKRCNRLLSNKFRRPNLWGDDLIWCSYNVCIDFVIRSQS